MLNIATSISPLFKTWVSLAWPTLIIITRKQKGNWRVKSLCLISEYSCTNWLHRHLQTKGLLTAASTASHTVPAVLPSWGSLKGWHAESLRTTVLQGTLGDDEPTNNWQVEIAGGMNTGMQGWEETRWQEEAESAHALLLRLNTKAWKCCCL